MNVSEAVASRISVRAFKADPVPADMVRDILERAARAPSGGNLQPWRVYALAGKPLEELTRRAKENPAGEPQDYEIYPPGLWEPFRTRRYECGEDLYAAIGIARDDKAGRLRQLARNGDLFDAPVGLFFCLHRKLGWPQWADLGMYMQTVMLLAREKGLDTCAQEYWARYPKAVAKTLELPDDHMLFAGMALGYRDAEAPINGVRTRRDPFESWGTLLGF